MCARLQLVRLQQTAIARFFIYVKPRINKRLSPLGNSASTSIPSEASRHICTVIIRSTTATTATSLNSINAKD